MSSHNKHIVPNYILEELGVQKPLSKKELEQVESVWNASSEFKYPEVDLDEKWAVFKSSIGADMQVTYKRPRYAMFRWVAAAVVLLVFGLAINNYYTADPGFTAIYKTENEKRSIALPDGSNLMLNAHTELVVNGINDKKREILLKSGQAYFSVKHNKLPFVVITPKGNISVLGTEFDVKVYKNQTFTVYLQKGKIEFKQKHKKVTLTPGQLLTEASNGQYVLSTISDNRELAWMDNQLVFENTSLGEIIKVLEEKFNVKFAYDERLKDEKFNVNVGDLNAHQMAELLSKLTNSDITVN